MELDITFVILVSLCVTLTCSQVYIDDSYPYEYGPLDVNVTYFSRALPEADGDNPEMHSTTYYPTTKDVYAVYYFISGFMGTSTPTLYNEFFPTIAAHGYVVFVTWNPTYLTDEGLELGPEIHFDHIEWLRENTVGRLGGAEASFDHMTISCFSAGCSPHIKLMANDSALFKASVSFDPSSFAIGRYDLDFGVPVLNLGSEYGTNNPNGTCVIPTLDYLAWHRGSICPRVMTQAKDVGHCSIVDAEDWEDCETACGGSSKEELIPAFKKVLMGNAVAFTGAYVQGNMDQLKYVTNETLIPWEMLRFDADVDC